MTILRRTSFYVAILAFALLGRGSIASNGTGETTATSPEVPVKKALLIGIDRYQSPGISTLAGAVNDVERMRSVLVGKFGFPAQNVRVLSDAQATRANVLRAIREHLVESDPPAKVAVLHFSGHGSQVADVSGDERDGWDETLVVHDSRVGDVFDITDDELGVLLEELAARTEHVTLIIDSCHSGTISRAAEAGATVRAIPPDPRKPPARTADRSGKRTLAGFRAASPKHVLIAGSRANELSNESHFDGIRQGALTYYLVRALQSAGKDTTYRDVMDGVSTDVTARFPAQHPEVDGPNVDKVIFGEKEIVARPYILVEPEGADRVKLGAGTLLGLHSGMPLDVFAPGTRNFDEVAAKVGRVVVSEARTFDATGKIVAGQAPPAARAVLKELRVGESGLRLYIDPEEVAIADRLRARLREHDSIRIVAAKSDAHLRVRGVGGQVIIEGLEGQTLTVIDKDAADAVDRAARTILHWARWHAVLALDNPGSNLRVDLRVQRSSASAQEPQPDAVPDKTPLTISVANRSSRPLHVIILGLFADGQVCVLAPTQGDCKGADDKNPIAPGMSATERIGSAVPEGQQRTFDVVKVLATTEWISPRVFELGPAPRDVASKSIAGEDALQRFLRRSVQGARVLEPLSVDGWATRQRRIEVHRAPQRSASYALHFDAGATKDIQGALAGSRTLCEPGSAVACDAVGAMRGDDSIVELRTAASRGTEGETIGVGTAFDEAYRLAEQTGAKRAEPLFASEAGAAERGYSPPGARGAGAERHDPRAEGDPLWSLKHARVPDAWQLVRTKRGVAAGEEASAVAIAHPDTGYLRHPEIWSSDPAKNPLWLGKGYDYYGEDDDPTDDLLGDQPLDNPAHGTGSGSAIISLAGCQLPGASKCPTGIAAGAKLVSLRVGRSVVHFDTRRLTQAILDASGGDRTHVKAETQLMSISMGGFPSWALWKAVSKAESRGFLVIAASGNYVGTVVWPARFESVISVAATNVGCKPWAHTSKGSRIDFSAPGESVWRATIGDNRAFVTGMGTGTTYATATTAGVAALWIAYHAGSPAFEDLRRQGRVVQAFRSLARDSASRPASVGGTRSDCDPDAGWETAQMGPGIIDAAALLSKPLPSFSSRDASPAQRLEDLPLWSSLYAPATSPAIWLADYRRLFGAGPGADLEQVARFEAEVLHHYATESAVLQAADRIAVHGNRSDDAFDQLRAALRRADLSTRLRERLPASPGPG